jgi:predicted AAA+ superfamily ATPase
MPAVALLGPRQCGKTTLAKSCGGIYLDIEQEKGRTHLDLGWEGFVTGNELIILDEAQTFPEVFQKLRGAIDEERWRNGRFLLLGSVSPALMLRVSESLAGRLGILELTPLLLPEIGFERLDDLWLTGGYPDGGIISSQDFPNWENDYLRLMAERDLPTWGLKASPRMTERLLKMTAALDAQPLNLSQLGQSLGISHPTVRSYLDFLEGAYLLRSLPPFHANIRKRLIKAPRLYWRDTGLLHSLMGVKTFEQLLDQPWVGASWEGFVIEQIISLYGTLGKDPEYYYFRTSDGHEIDLIVEFANERIGIEIKCTSSPSLQDFRRLKKTAEMCDCAKTYLISRTSDSLLNESGGSVNLSGFLRMIMEVSK